MPMVDVDRWVVLLRARGFRIIHSSISSITTALYYSKSLFTVTMHVKGLSFSRWFSKHYNAALSMCSAAAELIIMQAERP